jgi:hypothetical protein
MREQKKFEEFNDPIDLFVHTKSPEKWMLIDRETGKIYQGNPGGYWDRLDPFIKDKQNFTKQPE